jgi:hypothetical protein
MPRLLSNTVTGVNRAEQKFRVGITQFAILPYRENAMDAQSTVKIIAGVLALLLVVVIIMRRKKKSSAADDDF